MGYTKRLGRLRGSEEEEGGDTARMKDGGVLRHSVEVVSLLFDFNHSMSDTVTEGGDVSISNSF